VVRGPCNKGRWDPEYKTSGRLRRVRQHDHTPVPGDETPMSERPANGMQISLRQNRTKQTREGEANYAEETLPAGSCDGSGCHAPAVVGEQG